MRAIQFHIEGSSNNGGRWFWVPGAEYRSDCWYGTMDDSYDGREAARRAIERLRADAENVGYIFRVVES